MRGLVPIVTSLAIVGITLSLAAILATFVLGYADKQMTYADSCITGTLIFTSMEYPKLSNSTVISIVEAGGVDLVGFTVEAVDSTGEVWTRIEPNKTINGGNSGTVSVDFSGVNLTVGNKVRVTAINCQSAKTGWTELKS